MNLFAKKKQTYRYWEKTCGCQRGNVEGERINQELGVNIHTAMYKTDNQQRPVM